jgi:hypothetical protein
MRKFHHNKIINILSNLAVYSALTLILSGSLLILLSVVTGNTPTSFGIYG